MKPKLILLSLIWLGVCSCNSSQVVTERSSIKTVKEYIESNEFIDVIPEEMTQATFHSKQDEKAHLYKKMAVMYRFYKHCSMDEAGIITCNISSGKEINVSEEAFDMRIKEMNSWNNRIREKVRNGVKYKVVRIDDNYFENLLNFR
ncbi:hypothetical protein ACIXFJ_15410 [Bacteroides fragilis]